MLICNILDAIYMYYYTHRVCLLIFRVQLRV